MSAQIAYIHLLISNQREICINVLVFVLSSRHNVIFLDSYTDNILKILCHLMSVSNAETNIK